MERLLILAAIVLLAAALGSHVAGRWSRGGALSGQSALLFGWVAASAALTVRWVEAGWGHPPVADRHESLLLSAWALIGLHLVAGRRLTPSAAPAVIVVAVSALAAALLGPSSILPLVPALRSGWLTFHTVSLAVSYAAFAVAFALAIAAQSALADGAASRRGWLAAAALALVALGAADGTSVVASAACGLLAWVAVAAGGGGTVACAERAFHLGAWWTLLLGLALAEAGRGRAAAVPIAAGVLLALLSIASSPLVGLRGVARVAPWVGLPLVSGSGVAAMATGSPFPWCALPLALLPAVVPFVAGRSAPPLWVTAVVLAPAGAALAAAVPRGRGATLAAAFLVIVLMVLPRRGATHEGPDPAEAAAAEEGAFRMVLLGFPLLTAGIASGAAWARQAWGTYWGWDPKETWSLIVWLLYAAYLHARFQRRWAGPRATLFLVLGFMVVLFTYIGVSTLLPGLHSYL